MSARFGCSLSFMIFILTLPNVQCSLILPLYCSLFIFFFTFLLVHCSYCVDPGSFIFNVHQFYIFTVQCLSCVFTFQLFIVQFLSIPFDHYSFILFNVYHFYLCTVYFVLPLYSSLFYLPIVHCSYFVDPGGSVFINIS
jgi:hypothetical protein